MEKNLRVLNNFFNEDDIKLLINSDEVNKNYKKFMENGSVSHSFTITLTKGLQDSLSKYFSYFADSTLREVPMRWVIGEVSEHIDNTRTGEPFETSVVIYLSNDPTTVFTIDNSSYPIERNSCFLFSHGLKHKIEKVKDNISNMVIPRLIMGPMNEYALKVGCNNYGYFSSMLNATSSTNQLNYQCLNVAILNLSDVGLVIPYGYVFNGWLAYNTNPDVTNGFPDDQLYLPGEIYYDASYTGFVYNLYPSFSQIAANPYLVYGGGNSGGNFWYGNSTGFPGFLYKKNLGVGTRRSTISGAAGNRIAPNAYLYNKYKPGINGIGASTIANRRAKNRLASICKPKSYCGNFQPYLGRYSGYTWNVNGYFPYPKDPTI